jgi:two-component system cell cycle sensor histidine kinase/response regulator CckA
MKITTRMRISTLVSTTTVIVAGTVFLFMFEQIKKTNEEHMRVHEIVQGVFELNILTDDYLLYHEKRSQAQWRLKHDSLTKLLSTLELTIPEKQSFLSKMIENHEGMKSLFSRLTSIFERRNFDRGDTFNKELKNRLISQLLVKSQDMIYDAFQFEKKRHKELLVLQKRSNVFIMTLMFILLAIIVANFFLIGRSVVKPITKLHRDTEVIGKGNLDYKVGTESEDEVGQLSRAFDRMTENLKAITASRDELNKEIAERKMAEENLRRHQDHLEELVKDRTEALRESEEKYREVVETSVDGVISADSQMKVGVWNKGAEGIFGYTEEEMIGQSLMKIVPERYKKEMENGFVEFRKSGLGPVIGKTLELQGVRKDGTEIPVELSVSSRKKNETHIATAIVRDITERKQAEDRLKGSEEKYRSMMESMTDEVYIVSRDYRIEYMNPAMVKKIGYDATGELCFKAIHDLDEKCPWCNYDLIQQKKYSDSNIVSPKDNRSYRLLNSPIIKEDGTVSNLTIYRDITDLKKMEAQLLHVQKMDAIGRLAGGIAHDLNNLLTIITGYAKFAQSDLGKDAPQYNDIIEILEAGQRAASLTRQLLAFSRKQVTQPEILNLNDILKGTEKILRRIIGEDIDLVSVFDSGLWNIEVDPGQMEQVLMNLAVNAKDAMLYGGELTIETANMDLDEEYFRDHGVENTPGPYVMLAVSDNGMGMDKETRSHIFEPFYTTKERGKGTGLGLSTVYGIIKQNKGYIWVYSEPGEGTSFKVYFPAMEGNAGSVNKGDKILEDRLKGTETILLVEDDERLRRMAQKIFKTHKYTVLAASNGDEALRLSGEHEGPIHLLLTDVVMPGMSGKELAKQIESQRLKIKVLYMSGYTDNAIAHHGVLDKGINFIQKPFLPYDLVHKARKVLDQGIDDCRSEA